MRRNNYQYAMTVGKDELYYGYGEGVFGALESIAKPLAGKPASIFADANGDCRLVTNTNNYDQFGDEVVISFEGFNVEVAGDSATTSYGAPVRMRWDDVNEFYSTAGLNGARLNLTTWLSNQEGEVVYFKLSSYVKP